MGLHILVVYSTVVQIVQLVKPDYHLTNEVIYFAYLFSARRRADHEDYAYGCNVRNVSV